MNENPYKPSQADQKTKSIRRPLWIYLNTIAACLVVMSLPIIFGVVSRLYFSVLNPNAVSISLFLSVLSLSAMAGAIAGWRTWRRLSRVHDLQLKVQRDRELISEEYSQSHKKSDSGR